MIKKQIQRLKRALRRVPAFYRDATERIAWTFAQAGGGALLEELHSGHITWRAIIYAGLLAVGKAIAAKKFGNPTTASIP